MSKPQPTRQYAQQGAVLVITLVILVLITLISVSELNQAGQQIKMVNNAQHRNLTFQMAESGLIRATELVNKQLTSGEEIPYDIIVTIPNIALSNDHIDVSATYRANITETTQSGMSLNASENSFHVKTINVIITSTAYMPSSGVRTVLEQGLTYE